MPNIDALTPFQRLSSYLARSPFDGGLANRDRIVESWVARNQRNNPVTQATIAEVTAAYASVFPGQGGFGPGGGPQV